ncbi:MAG: molybdenum cofactor cytidylyltransferase [Chloroflexi bacterium]|nr:molybdenum cofactor cytidylyltransferase [Chloroflexota bacterium]MBL7062183.1 molybdenum cofactor cytidylyltransferase [Dehalococcoidia bacterium]
MISAILLAAGQSKRMGELKQLMPFGQSTIVEQAVDNLLGSAVDEVIVVVGCRAEDVIKAIAAKPIKLVINPDYEQGMSTSVIAGLNLVHSGVQGVMLALGDQPLVNSQTINRLIEGFYNHDKGIVVPTYQGRRGHPIIFAIKYKEQLLKLRGDVGGRQIIKDHPDDVLDVAVDSESIVADFDTTDDYQAYVG